MSDADADATRSQAPALAADPIVLSITLDPGETFVDEPEVYAIEGRIGAGGMGTVLAAKGSRLGRTVALKVVTADRDDLRRRFEREAQVTARLQHPAIVPVYGSGRGRGGHPFYAMKQVSGDPLDKAIANAATLERRIALLPNVIAVTDAIAYAHAERVIHRDLKPANILVGGFGETVVIDWGLAKDLSRTDDGADTVSPYRTAGNADATAIGKVMGTPAYMPLEQARGERLDERADVYALGAILYHVLAGAPPYARAGESGVPWESMLARVLSSAPPALGALQPGVPADLLAIVSRATARAPEDRYPTAKELADDLRKFQTGQLVGAHRYSTWQLVRRWLRRHRAAVSVAAVLLGVLAAGSAFAVDQIVDERDTAQAERARADTSSDEANARRRASEKLTDYMVTGLRDRLKTVGRLDILADLGGTVLDYYQSLPTEHEDADALYRRAAALLVLGDVSYEKGDSAAAKKMYTASLDSLDELGRRSPDDPKRLAGTGAAFEKLGDIEQRAGTLVAARASYGKALAAFERVVAVVPTQIEYHRSVGVERSKLAEMSVREGKLDDAVAQFRAARAALAEYAAAVPGDIERQRDLIHIDAKIADTLQHLGKADEAYAVLTSAQELGDALIRRAPDDQALASTVAIGEFTVADLELDRRQLAAAAARIQRGLDGLSRLAAHDPSNLKWQEYLLVGYGRVGQVELLQDHRDKSTAAYRAALAIARRLAEHDPTSDRAKSDVAFDLAKVADAEQAAGDLDGALRDYLTCEELRSGTVARNPKDEEERSNLASVEAAIGDVLMAKHAPGAVDAYRRALVLNDSLAADAPGDTGVKHDCSLDHIDIAAALRAEGKQEQASVELQTGVTLAGELATSVPDNAGFQTTFATALGVQAEQLARLHPAQARPMFDRAVKILDELDRAGKLQLAEKAALATLRSRL